MAATRAVAYVAGLGVVVPVLVGSLRLIYRPLVQRAAWVWMAYAFGTNVWMGAMGRRGEPNNLLSEFSLGLSALLITHVVGELLESTRTRRWLHLALVAFLVFWLWRALQGDYRGAFSTYSMPAAFLLFAVAGTVLVQERIVRASPAPMRDFGMLIGIGLVISYAPGAALAALSALAYDTHTDTVVLLWGLRSLFLIVGLVFFSLAFLWTIPPRSSSGSSASAA